MSYEMTHGNHKLDMYLDRIKEDMSHKDAFIFVCEFYNLDDEACDQLLTAISEL